MIRRYKNWLSLLLAVCLTFFAAPAAGQKYDLIIDGVKSEIELGSETKALIDGKAVTLRLERKEITEFADKFVAFSHPGALAVAKEELSPSVTQLLLANATGTMVIVQEYQGQDPAELTELMIAKTTESDIAEGYSAARRDSLKKLKNGQELKGLTVTTSRGDKKYFWSYYPYGSKKRALFIVTRINAEDEASDGKILKLFWDSLSPKF